MFNVSCEGSCLQHLSFMPLSCLFPFYSQHVILLNNLSSGFPTHMGGNGQRNSIFLPAATLKQSPSLGFLLRCLLDVVFHGVPSTNDLWKLLAYISHLKTHLYQYAHTVACLLLIAKWVGCWESLKLFLLYINPPAKKKKLIGVKPAIILSPVY